MNFKDLTLQRYSVRSYTDEPVSEEQLSTILDCARMAPSAVNFQPWHFYICQSTKALQKIQQRYNREWLKTAPMVIIACICHDEEWIRKSDGHAHGLVDIAIAAEHICLAAADLGLGSCWVCNFDVQLCRELFQLPENQEPAVLIPIGHSTDTEPTEKKRKKLQEIVTQL